MQQPRTVALVVALVGAVLAAVILASAGRGVPPAQHRGAPALQSTPHAASAEAPAPVDGQWAVINTDSRAHTITLETDGVDRTYMTCRSFESSAGLQPGDFATSRFRTDSGSACLAQLTVVSPPALSVCDSSLSTNGGAYKEVSWIGSNPTAHTIIVASAGNRRTKIVERWCRTPTVVAVDGRALSLALIHPGTAVRVVYLAGQWPTEVIVQHVAKAQHDPVTS